ncbi:MAG: cysteine hydrolase family protein [Spirochaetales bacterium]|nr:cysteine hydrolase family protein [Spirochaetales bacterium]
MITPKFYNDKKIDEIYLPRFGEIKEEAYKLDIKPSAKDKAGEKTAALLIDFQIDFCNKAGSLYVPEAEIDISNSIQFILKNFEKITTVYPTLDTHIAFQIFYGLWWLDENNHHPAPFTIITKDDVEKGKYKPVVKPVWSLDYIKNLEDNANKPLCIWPEHTMLGTPGHALVPALYEICYFHSITRKSQTSFQVKGDIPETEMYGVFSPEVKVPQSSKGGINTNLLKILGTHDKIVVMGEAKSHCVLESIRQLVDFFQDQPETLSRIYILEDCMSSVQHPDIDFEAIANKEFDTFRKKGLHIVKSTDDILV